MTKENDKYVPKSEWQIKTHFEQAKHTSKSTTTPAFPETSVLPAEAIVTSPPTPVITPELEQLILDQPIPESEPEPEFNLPPPPSQPEVELKAPLQKKHQAQPLRRSTRER